MLFPSMFPARAIKAPSDCAQSDQLAQDAVQSRFFIPGDCLARSSFELRTWVAVDQIEGFCRLG